MSETAGARPPGASAFTRVYREVSVGIVGTERGLFELSDTGAPLIDGSVSHALRQPGELWAIADDRVVRGRDGEGFEPVATGDGLTLHCLLPTGGGVLVGTSEAHLATLEGDDLVPLASFDAIEGRDEWYTPWGGPPDVRSLSPAPGGGALVNVHVGGIWRSPDLARWEQVVETEADVHQVHAEPDGSSPVVAAAAVGYGESDDGGVSWRWTTDGLHASYSRAVAIAGDVTLVTSSTGPFTEEAAVYRRAPGEGAFTRCGTGLPEWFSSNVDTHCLAARGADVILGTAEGDVYRSGDAGLTWDAVASGLPPVRCVAL